MPTSTTNYGLIKPGTDDPILIEQLNDNADVIDATLKSLSDAIDTAKLGIKYKGEVNYYSNLPASGNEIGDAYTVKYAGSSGTTPDGTEYVWGTVSGTNQWINFSKDSYTKAEVDALLALKQNALTTAQLAAANSGIDSAKVEQIETNKNNILLNTNNGVKNLLNIPTSQTVHGITFTKDGDEYVTSDTSNDTASYSAANANETMTLSAGTYTIALYPHASNTQSVSLHIMSSDSSDIVYVNTSTPTATFTFAAAQKIYIQYKVNQQKARFMICEKSLYEADPSYQPYAMSNAELTAAIQALQAQLANQ